MASFICAEKQYEPVFINTWIKLYKRKKYIQLSKGRIRHNSVLSLILNYFVTVLPTLSHDRTAASIPNQHELKKKNKRLKVYVS